MIRPPTNTLASVEPPSPCTQRYRPLKVECGRVSCGLSLSSGFLAVRRDCWRALQLQPATTGLARCPRIQVFCPRGAPWGVAASCVTSTATPPSVMEGALD